jgi:Endosomal/lysosomal potassium channel TMEM175
MTSAGESDADGTAQAEPKRESGLDRLVLFSDAVFAIAITLLALDLRLPEPPPDLTDAGLLEQLLELGPKYFSFVISFMSVGFYWIAHHRFFQLVVRVDAGLLLLNLLLLMGVAFIPFPTSGHPRRPGACGTSSPSSSSPSSCSTPGAGRGRRGDHAGKSVPALTSAHSSISTRWPSSTDR